MSSAKKPTDGHVLSAKQGEVRYLERRVVAAGTKGAYAVRARACRKPSGSLFSQACTSSIRARTHPHCPSSDKTRTLHASAGSMHDARRQVVSKCLSMSQTTTTTSSGRIFRPWDECENPDVTAGSSSMGHGAPGTTTPSFYTPPPDYLAGLPADLLLTHNFALEEYARVLSQDHQAKLLNARKQRPKKYKCPHCDVGFSNNGQLKGHIRIHTGERPFRCDEPNCGKTFTRNEELTRHKRIHSGLRPFACPQCGKRFGRKDHLKKHTRTHMQPRTGLFAVPVMLPFDAWAQASNPFVMPTVPLLY